MRKEPAQHAFPSIEPRPVSTLPEEGAASTTPSPSTEPATTSDPAAGASSVPFALMRASAPSMTSTPTSTPATDTAPPAASDEPAKAAAETSANDATDEPPLAQPAIHVPQVPAASSAEDDTTTTPRYVDATADGLADADDPPVLEHPASLPVVQAHDRPQGRTPTPPAHPLDHDPWPSFLAEVPPDAPTLVEPAPHTRASVMSVYVGPHMIAALSYVFWWLSGLIVYYNERRNRFVRFHAVQSILLTGTLTIFGVLAYVVSNLLFDVSLITRQRVYETLGQGLGLLAFFVILMLWLAPMIAAWSGAYLRLPIIGDYAERFAAIPIEVDTSVH